jgi:diguanylate cyclase (GGDEF)-like protein
MQLTLGYYAVIDQQLSTPVYQLNLFVYFISTVYFLARLIYGKQKVISHYLKGSITLSTLNWLLMSYVIYHIWQEPVFAEKMLIIGFFSTLICFNSNTFFLIISTLPIIIGDIFFKAVIRDIGGIDLYISIAKYPLFLVATVYTTLHFNKALRTSHQRIILLNDELTKLKNTDPLTGLNNRRVFDDKLDYAINVHNRLEQPLSLMIIDVDYFKNYNDSLGHPAGDQCLITLAHQMEERLQRQSDVLARIGGEEFAVILPATDIEQCRVLAQSLISTIEQTAIAHPDSAASKVVTISIGIACSDGMEKCNSTGLYKKADDALYQAKRAGRNQVAS